MRARAEVIPEQRRRLRDAFGGREVLQQRDMRGDLVGAVAARRGMCLPRGIEPPFGGYDDVFRREMRRADLCNAFRRFPSA